MPILYECYPDLGDGSVSTAPSRRRERFLTRTEAAAGAISDLADNSIVPPLAGGGKHILPSPPPSLAPPHTLTHLPIPSPAPQSLTSPPTPLTLHPYHAAITPVAGAVPRPQGFLVTGFSLWGAQGAYIYASVTSTSTLHHSRSPHTFPFTPPPIFGSPQAETSTSVYCHGRKRRHRNRHDGAVAHLAQPPAAAPRCRDLPDSSLADRAGQEPSRCHRQKKRGLSTGPSQFMVGLFVPCIPPPPNLTPPLPPHSPSTRTYIHSTHPTRPPTHSHSYTHTPAHGSMRGQAMLDPGPTGNI